MNAAWVDLLHGGARFWADGMARASWQGGTVIALAWAAGRALPALPPRVRCWLWRLAYLKLLLALVWATPIALPLLAARPVGVSGQWSVAGGQPAHRMTGLPRAAVSRQGAPRVGPAEPVGDPADDSHLPTGMLLLWLLGEAWCAARVAREWRAARRLCQRCEPAANERLAAECEGLCAQLRLHRAPRLRCAGEAGSPVLLGLLHPTLIFPAPLVAESSPAELRLMLAHELAHLKRQDLRWGWLPVVAHTLFYFHPLVWLANREWGLAQEMAADELAVLATGTPAAEYGEMLVRVATQLRRRPRLGLTTVGVLESPRTLRQRLRAMPHIRRRSPRRLLFLGALLAAAGLTVLLPWRLTARTAVVRSGGRRTSRRPVMDARGEVGLARLTPGVAVDPSAAAPMYFHTAFFANGTGLIARRSDLLNVPLDVDLRQVPLREALRRLCEPTHQGFVIDAHVPADQRVTVQGNGVQLFRALDAVIRQVGGGWMQELPNGKPTIRVGRDLFLTTHTGPLTLPKDRLFLRQIGAVAHLTLPAAEPAAR